MMKIAVVSDTHKKWQPVLQAIQTEGNIDYLIFLGDHYEDGETLQQFLNIPALLINGNCDYSMDGPQEQTLELENCRIFACHGHRYGVKNGYEQILQRSLQEKAEVVLFGHSHLAYESQEAGVYLINPGSAGSPRVPGDLLTWGLLTIAGKKPEKNYIKYEKKTCQSV